MMTRHRFAPLYSSIAHLSRLIGLLPALLLLGTSCEKEPREPGPTPSHIRIESPEVVPMPYEDPVGSAFQFTMRIVVDSLPDGEEILYTGICWTRAPEVPHYSDTILHIDVGIYPITADELPSAFNWIIPAPFLTPGERWNLRSYVRTDRDIYYSATVAYTPEASPTDHNCIDLPVIFHVLSLNPGAVSPRFGSYALGPQVANTNLALRGALKHSQLWEPIEDIHLRLVPATHTPSGERLAQPGLDIVKWDRLPIDPGSFLETPTPEELVLCWDPNRYLNVWIFPYGGPYTQTAGMALFPYLPEAHPLEGLEATDYYADPSNRDVNPGITLNTDYIYQGINSPLVHELGHVLGLEHAFSSEGCGTDDDYCTDTRDYDYSAFINSDDSFFYDFRTDCSDGTRFQSVNVMDYNGYGLAFTPDQNARIQHVLQYGYFIPGSETARRGHSAPSKAPAGLVRPTPRSVAIPAHRALFHTGRDAQ